MPTSLKILTVIGTRPEAIKMLPVIKLLDQALGDAHKVCTSGQQLGLLDQTCQQLGIVPDYRLEVMQPSQGINETVAKVITLLQPILVAFKPDWVLVHGDTTTCLGATLSAFYLQIKVAHIEAGLRSGNLSDPFPEESIRIIADQLASVCFAPTIAALQNLLKAGIEQTKIVVSGNTSIDVLNTVKKQVKHFTPQHIPRTVVEDITRGVRVILVTVHRNENRGENLVKICQAIKHLTQQIEVRFLVILHPHPRICTVLKEQLATQPAVHLLQPLSYVECVWAITQSFLLLTDSGGIQEEAPYLGTPVLLLRNTTERPEALKTNNVRLVGTDPLSIQEEVLKLWHDQELYASMSQVSAPYGMGGASQLIVNYLVNERS